MSANRSMVLTPPGAGAIGVIRVMGLEAPAILDQVFRPQRKAASLTRNTLSARGGRSPANVLLYGRFVSDGEVVDDVLVGPTESATNPGFDLCAHGGVRVMERILQELSRLGAPPVDLPLTDRSNAASIWPQQRRIQREALEAIGRAKTARSVRFLAWQRCHLICSLQHAVSLLRPDPNGARNMLSSMLERSKAARILVDGITLVILGPPNSGKSTLFNRLVGRPAAVVSGQSGTTRDYVSAAVEVEGIPITLVDTAGRHETANALEREAIQRGRVVGEQATLRIVVLDGSQPLSRTSPALRTFVEDPSKCLFAINKADRDRAWDAKDIHFAAGDREQSTIRISARTGAGLDQLLRHLQRCLGFDGWADNQPAFFTDRQVEQAEKALSDLPRRQDRAEKIIRTELIEA